jgi:hypothetical protein
MYDPQTYNLIVTVAYTIVTILIWHSTRQSINLTRRIFEDSHRPYVCVAQVQANAQHSGHAALCAKIESVGAVPSRNIKVNLQLSVNGKVEKEISAGPDVALLPDQHFTACLAFGADSMWVFSPPNEVVVSIEITYQGMGDKTYKTQTSSSYTSIGKPFSLVSAVLE